MGDVPKSIAGLIERFDRNVEAYRAGRYNETAVRRDFIDPFFEALGWDMNNRAGLPEAYRDVIHEDAIKIGGATKAPDYCFRIGGTRKFFVEAKKPAVNIARDIHPAYQLRRYAWSAKLPLSILTDFEEFAVYDCRVRPKRGDKPAVARTMYLTYTQYVDKWDDIAGIFAQDAISQGSFDKYVVGRSKRGTAEVDAEFLKEIEKWRAALARNIALRNGALGVREINFAVQRTIDRIIFLRMAEDRGVEEYATLQALINGTEVYARLMQMFRTADDRYNSGLFHFNDERGRNQPPDTLTPDLTIDDKVLKDIFRAIYYPDSPYEFSVLPADILGNVYEQFLGKVIHLTKGHQARVEEKPEVKKAGGVYYTPRYIVDYIVKHTVGKLIEGKTPREVGGLTPGFKPSKTRRPLRVLDPACGSGSFLLGAYRFLLDYHRDWYVIDGPEKHTKRIYQGAGEQWYLTTAEKKRILLSNIYGVDIDSQAVEVTKLNLLLCVLENETQGSIGQLALIRQRVLPDLSDNIKCGNSLIGPDFYEGEQLALFDDETRYRINAFDWHAEFPHVFKTKHPGFDAVIGNPPYIFTREQLTAHEREYFAARYEATWEKHNTFMVFMERMLGLLCTTGKGGFIVPNSWLTIESAHLLRGMFIPHLETIADLNYTAFNRVSMEPCVFIISGSQARGPALVVRANSPDEFTSAQLLQVSREMWLNQPRQRIVFSHGGEAVAVVDKIVGVSGRIGDVFDVRSGLQAYEKGKGNPPQTARDVKNHLFDRDKREDGNSYRYLRGRDVGRYVHDWSGMWMQYGPWLAQPRQLEIFTRPRVLLREITSDLPFALNAAYISEPFLNNKSILNLVHPHDSAEELKCLLGVLNSRLISFFYKHRGVKSARRIFPKVVIRNVREFPYTMITDVTTRARMVALVERMLELHKELPLARTDHDKTLLKRRIAATDKQIDQLVYELYGLTEEEIAIVEGGMG